MTLPCILVISTCPDQATAQAIGEHLVGHGLAACVNILPGVQSIYRWQDRLEQDQELMLFIKTTQDKYLQLEEEIITIHPYELPEIIAVSIETGHEPYLQWITGSKPNS